MNIWFRLEIDLRKLSNLANGSYSIETYFLNENRAFSIEVWIIVTNEESKGYSHNARVL